MDFALSTDQEQLRVTVRTAVIGILHVRWRFETANGHPGGRP